MNVESARLASSQFLISIFHIDNSSACVYMALSFLLSRCMHPWNDVNSPIWLCDLSWTHSRVQDCAKLCIINFHIARWIDFLAGERHQQGNYTSQSQLDLIDSPWSPRDLGNRNALLSHVLIDSRKSLLHHIQDGNERRKSGYSSTFSALPTATNVSFQLRFDKKDLWQSLSAQMVHVLLRYVLSPGEAH